MNMKGAGKAFLLWLAGVPLLVVGGLYFLGFLH